MLQFKKTTEFCSLCKSDLKNTALFLQKHEPYCLSLVQNFVNKSADFFILKDVNLSINSEIVTGVIAITAGGTIFHYLKDIQFDEFLQSKISDTLIKYPIFCINGEKRGSDFLVSILKNKKNLTPKIENSFHLMIQEKVLRCNDENKPFLIRKCTQKDIEQLLPLEILYQKEEVIPPGHKVAKPEVYRFLLTKQIKNQFVFCAKNQKNQLIAMAAANAIGWNYAQIGGVFTSPSFRHKGIATSLINEFTDFLLEEKKTSVLFVKTQNSNAISLYNKCNFKKIAPYKILYYF